jgi:hypothetical protein
MSSFQWSQVHIDWVVSKFIDKGNVCAADISHNYTRKAGEPRFKADDFRRLMQLVVKNKLARVTKGHIASDSYRIRIVSDDYPYVPDDFDEMTFSWLDKCNLAPDISTLAAMFPGVDNWNSHEKLTKALALLLLFTIFCCNFCQPAECRF